MQVNSAVILTLLISRVVSQDDFDLPAEIIQEFQQIVNNSLTLSAPCGSPNIDESQVRLLLYRETDPTTPIILNASNADLLDTSNIITFVSHGWLSSENQSYLLYIRREYLKRYGSVVMVDWAPIAFQVYTKSYCELRGVAEVVGAFLCLLSQSYGVVLSIQVQLFGHSLGAHMFGFAGNYTQEHCSARVRRIIGADPAGPLFQDLSGDDRLDPADAEHVETHQSNGGVLGYDGPCGHAHFFVNGGHHQPACDNVTLDNNLLVTGETTIGKAWCSHNIILDILGYGINPAPANYLIAKSCTYSVYLKQCPEDGVFATLALAGEDCSMNTNSNHQLLTNPSPPYGTGCSPYPSLECPV